MDFLTHCHLLICHFYGVQSWNLSDKHTSHFFTAWNRCARRLLELHPATHTRYLTAMVGWNSQSRIICSTRRLIKGVCSHPESWISFLGRHGINDMNSIIGSNKSVIEKRLNDTQNLTMEDEATLMAVQELRAVLKQKMTLSNFKDDELSKLIEFLCIN